MELKLAVRIIAIKESKVLLINNLRDDFFYFIGGKVEAGESLEVAAKREISEEAGMNVKLEMIKPLYMIEMIRPVQDRHKFEIFILAEIDMYQELEGIADPQHNDTDRLEWHEIDNLPEKLLPNYLLERFPADFANGFDGINLPYLVN